jgi:hypothetical protein
MATDQRIICLLLSQYSMELLDSSTEEGDSNDEEENDTCLAVIASIEIEKHPRQVGYLNVISLYSDNDFYRHFRITRTTFLYVLCYLQDENFRSDIAFHGGCYPMTIAEVLFISLQYLGNQGAIRLLADKFNRTESSIWKAIGDFCHFMFGKQSDFIKWPTTQEIRAVSRKFLQKAMFPGVVCALDGSHIPFHPKSPNKTPYRNYKKFHSFNVMAAALPNRSFCYVFCGFPGSVHDSTVFQNCSLFQKLDTRCHDLFDPRKYHIIADSAFPLKEWLITPYKKSDAQPLSPAKKLFNRKLSSTRMVIELIFGDLKNRFKRCTDVNTSIDRGVQIVVTCCVLHNICIQQGDLFYGGNINPNDLHCNVNPNNPQNVVNRAAERKRQLICDSLQTRRPVIAFRRRHV